MPKPGAMKPGSLFWGRLAALGAAGACAVVNAIVLATGKREKPV